MYNGLRVTTTVTLDPQDIADEHENNDIREFILNLNGALENEDFTIALALDLLKSSDCPESIIKMIREHYDFEAMD